MTFFPLEYYAYCALINFLTSGFYFARLLLFRRKRLHHIRMFAWFCFSIAFWSLFYFFWLKAETEAQALFFVRTNKLFVAFMPTLFIHFVINFLGIQDKTRVLKISYALSIFFAASVYTPYFCEGSFAINVFPYWGRPKVLFYPYMILFFGGILYAYSLMIRAYRNATGQLKNQIVFIVFGTLLGFICGSMNYFHWFNINIPPFLNIFVTLDCVMVTYSILHHHILDRRIFFLRLLFFSIVYSIGVGIPLVIGLTTDNWYYALWLLILLVGFGALIYSVCRQQIDRFYTQKDVLLKDRLFQEFDNSYLINSRQDLCENLKNFITKVMDLRGWALVLRDGRGNSQLEFCEGDLNLPADLSFWESSQKFFLDKKYLYRPAIDERDADERDIKQALKEANAQILVPVKSLNQITGCLFIGDRIDREPFSREQIESIVMLCSIFSIQLQNIEYSTAEKENLALVYQSSTMANLGVLADSMGHQIKNHIQKMTAQAGTQAVLLEALLASEKLPDSTGETLKKLRDALEGMEKQGVEGARLIESISRYSRLPRQECRDIHPREAIETALDLLKYKINDELITVTTHVDKDVPKIYAHPIISEALFNLMDNACDAIAEKYSPAGDHPRPPGLLRVGCRYDAGSDEIIFFVQDNGAGIADQDREKLFIPFFTTKATAEKGGGLGLFVIKRIVEQHNGRVTFQSSPEEGTRFELRFKGDSAHFIDRKA